MIEVLGVKNASKLVPVEDDQIPTDPVQENQNLLTGKPIKAFVEQNHEAHIQAHMAAIQNPKIQQMMQQNPQAQAIMAAAMAHVNEHLAFEYRKQVELELGAPLPTEEQNKQIPPEIADQIAMAVAKASQKLTQRDQQEAQQQQAQQQMQDPVIQMQQQELKLKGQELELKAQKQKIEAAEKTDRLRIDEARIAAQKEIAAMQVAATAAAAKDKLAHQSEIEGVRMGMDAAKHRTQMAVQQAQRAAQKSPSRPKKEND
jgi:hypothetical protein